jgi:AraC-like DNA-binding protein
LEVIERWKYLNLAAPFWRIYVNFNKGASIISGKKKYLLEPGKFFLISPDTEYSSDHDNPFEHFYVHFQAGAPYDFCPGKIYLFDIAGEEHRLLDAIIGHIKNPPESIRAISMPLLVLCHALLARVPQADLVESWNDRRVIDVVNFIEKNMRQRISNETLAEIAGMSQNAFARLFKKQAGMSPQNFLAHKRVTKACMLLRYSKHSIEDVAEMSGFCDRYYFTRVFTNLRNISPAAFRKLNH